MKDPIVEVFVGKIQESRLWNWGVDFHEVGLVFGSQLLGPDLDFRSLSSLDWEKARSVGGTGRNLFRRPDAMHLLIHVWLVARCLIPSQIF